MSANYTLVKGSWTFEWDVQKSASNRRRHGVDFTEACQAFFDRRAVVMYDEAHSEREDRFTLLGMSSVRLLVVCHCYRHGDVIRLISARRADAEEHHIYAQGG